jgi:hypothetical protein
MKKMEKAGQARVGETIPRTAVIRRTDRVDCFPTNGVQAEQVKKLPY